MNTNNQYKVELIIKTLKKGKELAIRLFNYNYSNIDLYTEIKTIKRDCYVLRASLFYNYSIKEIEDPSKIDSKDEILFRVRQSFIDNKFEIIKPIRNNLIKEKINLNDYAWYVIKSKNNFYENNNDDYILNKNDILSFGYKKYEISKIYIKSKQTKLDLNNKYNISAINKEVGSIFDINLKYRQYLDNKIGDFLSESTVINNKNISCTICEKNECSEKNPLLQLCNCKNYKHYNCLLRILEIKDEPEEKVIKKNFYCNECFSPYPLEFKISNNIFSLINFNTSSEIDYIILEPLNEIKDKENIKPIYIAKLIDKEIKIGRNIKNDLIDNHSTVSNFHAVIKYDEGGNLIIENLSETYNTSVLIKGNIKLSEKKINFQVGYSYISARQINASKVI